MVGNNPKILIVDDDEQLCELYQTILEAQGYNVIVAFNGEEALSKSVKERPDLILLDIMMPQIHGINVLDILKATPETKDVKVVMISALSDEETKKKSEQLGALDYIVKSEVDTSGVLSRIENALKR